MEVERRELRTDEQLEQMLSDYEVKEPTLASKCEKTIARVCVNPDCDKNAFMCNEINCDACGIKAHQCCLSIPLCGLTKIIGSRALRQKKFLEDTSKIQNQFIDQLFHSRKELTKKYYLGDLEQKYMKIFYDVFKDKQTVDYMKGKQAKEFYERLIKVNDQANQNTNLLLQNYRKSIKTMVESLVDLKNRIYESFVKVNAVTNPLLQINSNILKKPLNVKLEDFKQYDSLIVKHCKSLLEELAAEQGNFLQQILNNPKNIELLYRGSENGFAVSTFHQKCDNIPNTLVLVRTQFGKTIGGFTQYTWNAVSSGTYVSEAGKKSFLFSLDMKEKFVPKDQTNLIHCNTGYGPTFGGGHDLYIANQCNANNSSYVNFPSNYNREGQNKLPANQETYTAFCGAPSGSTFRVLQYQVFRITY